MSEINNGGSNDSRFSSMQRKAILASIIVLVLAISGYFARGLFVKSVITSQTNEAAENALPLVEVRKLSLLDIKKTLRFVGNLKPNEQVVLKSEVDAVIKTIHFFEGQAIQEGDLLVSFDDAAAVAQLEEVTAKYMNAKAEFEMTKKLANKKYSSESELSKKEAEMKAFYAQIKQVTNTLNKHKVYAPFSGKVGLKEVSVGEFMNRGRDLLTLVDEVPMKVDFKVPEMLIHRVRVGQYVTVNVDGVNNDFTAVIRAVDPVGDKTSHSFIVRAILDNDVDSESYGIYPGQFARIRLINDDAQKAILVPEGTLVRSGDVESVYRIVDGTAIQTEVIVGDSYDGQIEILGGLSAEDVVVINGQGRIRDGMKVRVAFEEDVLRSLSNSSENIENKDAAKDETKNEGNAKTES